MPRRKKDQSEAETENLPLSGGDEAAPAMPAAVEEAAPRARRGTAANNGNGNGRPALDAGRRNAIEKTLTDLTKRFGDGAIMRLGEAKHMNVESIPTGSLALDLALGIGGVPRGRVTEIYGPESAGKTTVCQHIVAEAQKRGGVCGLHRHGARPRSDLCRALRGGCREPVHCSARHRRAGPGNCRGPGALGRHGRGGDRLGGRPGAAGRDRRRDGRQPHGPAGPPHVAGAAQALGRHQAVEHRGDLHQPIAPEDRRHVRQPRNHHRRQRA